MKLFEHLEIETQGSCNRSCPTCIRQSFPAKNHPLHKLRMPVTSKIGEGTKMPWKLFKKIIDQANDLGFEGTVCLQHYNEPLLDERLPELASYIRENLKGCYYLGACTNMDLINEPLAKKLDGLFHQFDVALYMDEEKQAKREKYINSLFKKTKIHYTKGVHYYSHYSPWQDLGQAIKDASNKPCTYYNHQFIIACDGTVLQCCDDYTGHFDLGNVKEKSLAEVWFGKKKRELDSTLSEEGGRLNYEFCSICPKS